MNWASLFLITKFVLSWHVWSGISSYSLYCCVMQTHWCSSIMGGGEGRWFFFSWYNQVALFTWACLLTEIMFYIEFFLYFSRKFAQICKNQLSEVTSRDLEWVKHAQVKRDMLSFCQNERYFLASSLCTISLFLFFFSSPTPPSDIDFFFIHMY